MADNADKTLKKTISRRTVLKAPLAASVGVAALGVVREATGAKTPPKKQGGDGGDSMPYGMIGGRKVSRLILGSNTPGCHSRDLIYVSALGRAYNTHARMLDTYELAIVHAANPKLELSNRPLVRIVSTPDGARLDPGPIVDTAETNADGAWVREIIKVTNPEKYGINPSDYFV